MTTQQDGQQEKRESRIRRADFRAVIDADWPFADPLCPGLSMADFYMALAKLNARTGLIFDRLAGYAAMKRDQAEAKSAKGKEDVK